MIWRTVVGFPAYEVSNTGLVRTKLEHARLNSVRNQGGYRVRLVRAGKIHDKRVNVIVLEAFVGPRPSSKYKCVYVDGKKQNNSADNLLWVRRKSPDPKR